jgi:hypothetical protein
VEEGVKKDVVEVEVEVEEEEEVQRRSSAFSQ